MTEQQILDHAYYILEQDDAGWDTDSQEYLTARGILNASVGRWEFFDNTRWRELWTTLTASATGDKTTTADDYTYTAPTTMRYPSSWVRTISGSNTWRWEVISPEKLGSYAGHLGKWCYFTGNPIDGFTLHFNPMETLITGDTIEYEFYKIANQTDATTDTIEMQDPWFSVYYVAAHMADGGVDTDFYDMAEARLDQMKTANHSQLYGVPDNIALTDDTSEGFGY